MHEALFEQIHKIGLVPVVKIDDAGKAVGLAKAMVKGGLPCAEVT
ncbi:MAG TPA: 2-dehydro-3-deoxyphosphogluconate aldolase, partial [Sphaerochaeta sp.]|nr:2-dehydro-3-deoxyphosphogluconate aldolase [Sphaerochaeta sp.]